jgi:hypothetical protein
MYCSSCGGAVTRGLSYCNHCGAKLNAAKGDGGGNKASELSPESLVWAIVAVFTVGIGTTIGMMAVMKDLLDFSNRLIVAFSSLTLLLTLIITGVFIFLLMDRRREAKEAGDALSSKEKTTKELDAAEARALPEPARSVTEHTTRSFEPIYSERKSK